MPEDPRPPIFIRPGDHHLPLIELHLPPMVLSSIFSKQIEDLLRRAPTDGWPSHDPVLLAAAHTCRLLRLHLLPFIYNDVHIYRLKSLSYLNQVLEMDPDSDLRVAPHIYRLNWAWNPCGPYSSIWGFAGAFCDRRPLRRRIAAGKYTGIHDSAIDGPLPPAARIQPGPWSYPQLRSVPPLHSTLDTGPDGDGDSTYKEPLHIVKAIGKLARKLSALRVICWNAAILPPPPCLFASFSREHPLKELIIYNEHNMGDRLQTPYDDLPQSIEHLSLCIHRKPDLQIPTSTFVKARRDAQRQYLKTFDLHSHPLLSNTNLERAIEECVPDSDIQHCTLLAWPTFGSEDLDKSPTNSNDFKPNVPLNSHKSDETPKQALVTPEGLIVEEVTASSGSAFALRLRLPWPWLDIAHFGSYVDDTVTVEMCPSRELGRKLPDLYVEGKLSSLALCAQSCLHHRISECQGMYGGVGPTHRQQRAFSADLGSRNPSSKESKTLSGLCATGKACYEHPSLFETVEIIPFWMGIGLHRWPCYPYHAAAAACLDGSSSQADCSLCLVADTWSASRALHGSICARDARRDEAWEAAHLLRWTLGDVIRELMSARAHSSGHLGLRLGQTLFITAEDINFLIQHGGWSPAEGPQLDMGARCSKDGIDLHCRATILSDRSIRPRFGVYQDVLLNSVQLREATAGLWNRWQLDWTTQQLRERAGMFYILPASPAGVVPPEFRSNRFPVSVALPIEWRYMQVGIPRPIMLGKAVYEWGNSFQDSGDFLNASLENICSCTRCSKGARSDKTFRRTVRPRRGGKVPTRPPWMKPTGESKQNGNQGMVTMPENTVTLEEETHPASLVRRPGLGSWAPRSHGRQMNGEARGKDVKQSVEKDEEEGWDGATLVAGSNGGHDSDGSETTLDSSKGMVMSS